MAFSIKVAKEIAKQHLAQVIDCIIGNQDPDLTLYDDIDKYEDEFHDLLKDKKINPTEFRINEIKRQFLILRERIIIYLKKQQ